MLGSEYSMHREQQVQGASRRNTQVECRGRPRQPLFLQQREQEVREAIDNLCQALNAILMP